MDKAYFPNLLDHNYTETSPCTSRYNCIAWAAGDNTRWWQPSPFCFWPAGVPRERTLSALIQAFETLGYTECKDGSMASGHEKVAIYAKYEQGELVPTHAARQLPSGGWSSKLGGWEDIFHAKLEDINSPTYGEAVRFMGRPTEDVTGGTGLTS